MILEQVAHVDAGRQQRVALKVGGLAVIVGRYAHVADKHVRKTRRLRFAHGIPLRHHFPYKNSGVARVAGIIAVDLSPVSYTHLTLPTSDLV